MVMPKVQAFKRRRDYRLFRDVYRALLTDFFLLLGCLDGVNGQNSQQGDEEHTRNLLFVTVMRESDKKDLT